MEQNGNDNVAAQWKGDVMRFLTQLLNSFARRPAAGAPGVDRVAAIIEETKARATSCLRLIPGGDGSSRLGGAPDMKGEWPRYHGRPLSFVAQLDAATMCAAGGPDWLPQDGRLLFFYELEHGGWGLESGDAGCFAVRHETGSASPALEPADLPDGARFPAYPVSFVAAPSYPDQGRLQIDWRKVSKAEYRALEAALEALAPPEPAHQVGGYPGPIQADEMERECQVIFGGKQGAEVEAGAADWRLLLQLDTDDGPSMMWGDTGRLYFWVREQDARSGDFSKSWMILQCC